MDHRMFDFSAFYARMAEELPDGAVCAEVGVANGTSAIFLAETMLNLGKKFHLYMIDNLEYGKWDQLRDILWNVSAAGLGEWVEILPIDSLNASTRFPDVHFDFVFLDSSHLYELTKAEIRVWYPKIKEDGILGGHDYTTHEEVGRAVDLVIPKLVPNREGGLRTLRILELEETELGYGVWWLRKRHYVKLN